MHHFRSIDGKWSDLSIRFNCYHLKRKRYHRSIGSTENLDNSNFFKSFDLLRFKKFVRFIRAVPCHRIKIRIVSRTSIWLILPSHLLMLHDKIRISFLMPGQIQAHTHTHIHAHISFEIQCICERSCAYGWYSPT